MTYMNMDLIWILRACMMIAINYFRPMTDVPALTPVRHDSLSANRSDPILTLMCQHAVRTLTGSTLQILKSKGVVEVLSIGIFLYRL